VPIYEYECGACQCRFEKKQGFDAEPVVVCPECRGDARRVFYPAPIIFKGSGFYITDSRKKTEPKKSKEEASGKEKGEGKK